ncbi:adenylyltransferase/cytidyltransferase family protein [Vulcanisaeta distributa]|uniref:adenylyltransferase/cytidyltransferase family protein n=1 Tax=Vulcanisaeta distributa TaxID=164451 RepID=UPI000ACC52FE|nr:adenylyltransferase/cytidyltransferase family protein [Vulcanisaeta distributa]
MVRALFVGRFQPLHRGGHEEVIKWLLGRHDELVIAIGSANESFTPRNHSPLVRELRCFTQCLGS